MGGNVHVSSVATGINKHELKFICEKATIILESKKGVTENFTLKVLSKGKTKKIIVKKTKNKKSMPREVYSQSGGEDERVKIVRKIASRFVQGCKNKVQVTPSFIDGVRVQELIEEIRDENI